MTFIQSWLNRLRPIKTQSADHYNLTRFKVGAWVRYVSAPGKVLDAYIAAIPVGADTRCGECTLDVINGYARAILQRCFFDPHTKGVGTWHWE